MTSVFARNLDRRTTPQDLLAAKRAGERFAVLTAYDYLIAGVFDEAGIPMLIVGDSAAMVVFGHDNTLPVTMEQLLPCVQAVVRGTKRAMVVADLPFGAYQSSSEQALASAIRYVKEGGAHAVKLEGGRHMERHVKALTAAGIPTMGHIGMTPQSVNVFGGFKVQGRADAGERLLEDAKALEAAGAFSIVLEAVPAEVGKKISTALTIPTISIGAGPFCDAQVLVWQDLLGLTPGQLPKYVKRYADLRSIVRDAANRYADDVRSGEYPSSTYAYQ